MGNTKQPERLCGVSVPLGALRGKNSAGVGEYPDLIELGEWCVKAGIGLIQILPVNDTGYESSPYSALTAFALHPLYISIASLPEASGFKDELDSLKKKYDGAARFNHEKLLREKMKLLRAVYSSNKKEIEKQAENGGAICEWIAKNPWVTEYAVYRRLKELNGEKSWKAWEGSQSGKPNEIQKLWGDPALFAEHLFWVWLQVVAEKQFSAASQALTGMGLLLEGDLPILMNEDSVDTWAHGEFFEDSLSAGAPPDMYSPDGQNWGFPTYNWQAQAKDNYSWWKGRLKQAEKFYGAYRIDHVLGFFRIWATSRDNYSATLGRYVPYVPFNPHDFNDLGYDEGRVRWVCQPHIPTEELRRVLAVGGLDSGYAEYVCAKALDRIGEEELWIFKPSIKGERDIVALGLQDAATGYLCMAWRNRIFMEYENHAYTPMWYYRESRAYKSFSQAEKEKLETMIEKRNVKSEAIWEDHGRRLLSVLIASSSMIPCAEDLGAVPPCVPRVLTDLKVLGLRVMRWFRNWEEEEQPFIPLEEYPELSVSTPAVHDTSTVREWWEREADQYAFRAFAGDFSIPDRYDPRAARAILGQAAGAASCFRVFQIQDLLHLSDRYYAEDPTSERVNVPGTANEFNWTYRVPVSIDVLKEDASLSAAVKELSATPALKTGDNT